MYVLIYGLIQTGVDGVIGPFATEDEALAYGDTYNLGHVERFCMRLEEPNVYAVPRLDSGR